MSRGARPVFRVLFRTLFLALFLGAGPSGGVVAGQCAVLSDLNGFTNTRSGPSGAVCSTYLATNGATATSCSWNFDYRSSQSRAFAQELWQMISGCATGQERPADIQVNHPDSYDLRIWQADRATLAVSVKDKASLNRTYVFVRSEPIRLAD